MAELRTSCQLCVNNIYTSAATRLSLDSLEVCQQSVIIIAYHIYGSNFTVQSKKKDTIRNTKS